MQNFVLDRLREMVVKGNRFQSMLQNVFIFFFFLGSKCYFLIIFAYKSIEIGYHCLQTLIFVTMTEIFRNLPIFQNIPDRFSDQ